MSHVVQLLHEQLDTYSLAWQHQPPDAITARELAAQIRIAVALYRAIFDLHCDLGDIAQPGHPAFDYAKARQIEELYKRWDVPGRSIWSRVKKLRDDGHRIEGAEEFRDIYLEVGSLISIPIDHILEAQKQLREGRKIPHAEVVNAVRRRVGA